MRAIDSSCVSTFPMSTSFFVRTHKQRFNAVKLIIQVYRLTKKMHNFLQIILIFRCFALHVSGVLSVHHQEHHLVNSITHLIHSCRRVQLLHGWYIRAGESSRYVVGTFVQASLAATWLIHSCRRVQLLRGWYIRVGESSCYVVVGRTAVFLTTTQQLDTPARMYQLRDAVY